MVKFLLLAFLGGVSGIPPHRSLDFFFKKLKIMIKKKTIITKTERRVINYILIYLKRVLHTELNHWMFQNQLMIFLKIGVN